MDDIKQRLISMSDEKYKSFQARIINTVDKEKILGIKTPDLRKLAKKLVKEGSAEGFMRGLPHEYFDENQLHALIISDMKGYDEALAEVNSFLPYVDNWATCDQLRPKAFKQNRSRLIGEIRGWLGSEHIYTVRFGIEMLMVHFLGEDFKPEYLRWAADITSGEYYLKMMVAWYFAEALALRYDESLPYIKDRRLDPWVHNKAIQKATESRRIPEDIKEYLKTLKI